MTPTLTRRGQKVLVVIRSFLVPDGPIADGFVEYRDGLSDEELARMCSYLLGHTLETRAVERIRQEFCGLLESEWHLSRSRRKSQRRKKPTLDEPMAPLLKWPAEPTIDGLAAKITKKAAILKSLSKRLDALESQPPAVQSGTEEEEGRASPLIEEPGPEEPVMNGRIADHD
jgi:hypothetical protein